MDKLHAGFHPGHIVKVRLNEHRGGGKVRWMLVLSDLQKTKDGNFYLCVAISTTFPEPPPAVNFPLPWHPMGSVSTGLRRRSAAVLDWFRQMPPESIIQKDGYVSKDILQRVLKAIESFGDGSGR